MSESASTQESPMDKYWRLKADETELKQAKESLDTALYNAKTSILSLNSSATANVKLGMVAQAKEHLEVLELFQIQATRYHSDIAEIESRLEVVQLELSSLTPEEDQSDEQP